MIDTKEKHIGGEMADKIYTTILGDTWDSIAYKLFDDSKLYNSLLELNEEYSDVIVFKAGVKLKYQEIDSAKKANTNVPPWRR